MTTRTITTLVFVAMAVAVPASGQTTSAPYAPWLERVLLSRCDSIVVADVAAVTEMPNRERLIRFRVSSVLKGREGDTVLVIGSGGAVLRYRDLPKLLFLDRTRRSTMRVVVDYIDLPRADGASRVEFTRRLIGVAARKAAADRLEGVRRLVFDHLAAKSPWVRRVLVREIEQIARGHAHRLDGADLLRLRQLDVSDLASEERRRLRNAVLDLEEANAVGWTRDKLVFPDEETRQSFLADLAAFQRGTKAEERVQFLDRTLGAFGRRAAPLLIRALDDDDQTIRRHAAFLLGEVESGAGWSRLVAIASDAKAPIELRRGAVVALAKIAPLRAAAALERLVELEPLRRDALTALAAINTAEAALFLKDYDEALRNDPASSPALRWHLAYLRGDAFRKDQERERRVRRKKYPR